MPLTSAVPILQDESDDDDDDEDWMGKNIVGIELLSISLFIENLDGLHFA